MKKEVFTLGKENEDKRTYSMTFLTPMDGMRLALKLCKLLADMPLEETLINSGENEKIVSIMRLLKDVDTELLTEDFEKVLSKISVHAKHESETESKNLNNKAIFNAWFLDHPGDLLIFVKEIIWRNASPFLSLENLTVKN